MTVYRIGIDSGVTSCRAAVAGPDRRILARAQAGPANILSDPDKALENIADATRAAFNAAGIDTCSIASARAVLGVAGNNVGDAVHYVKNRLPFAEADIESDGLIALQGALGDNDGAAAILGTGTIYIARHRDTVTYTGGWGFTVGDLGSGARIGHALLQEALLAHDGIHHMSAVSASVLAEFKNEGHVACKIGGSSPPREEDPCRPKPNRSGVRGSGRSGIDLFTALQSQTSDAMHKEAGEVTSSYFGSLGHVRLDAQRHK